MSTHTYLTHTWHNTRRVHSTHGITRDVSIPCYGKHGPREHVTRFLLPVSCYHMFPSMQKWSYNWILRILLYKNNKQHCWTIFTQLQNSLCVVALYRPSQLLPQIHPCTASCGTEDFTKHLWKTYISLGTLVPKSRNWHKKMATKFFALHNTP